MSNTANSQKLAEASFDKVLGLYEKEGVTLSRRPRIVYSGKPHPVNADLLATCDLEDSASAAHVDFVSRRMAGMIWKQAYGIDVSQEALDEYASALKRRYGLSSAQQGRKASHDILVFSRFGKMVNGEDESDFVMAHEVWHLVEDERGVFEQATLITEGTATYAAARLLGARCNRPVESFENYMQALYVGGANLVQSRVEKKRHPFAAMLDPKLRVSMQEELIRRITPRIEALITETLKNPDYKQAAINALMQDPGFAALRGNVTRENLIMAYRRSGAPKLADELEEKDLSGLIYWFKEIGF